MIIADGEYFSNGSKFAQITDIDKGCYWLDSGKWIEARDIKLWSIAYADDGDIIYADSKFGTFNFIYIFSELKNENSWLYCSIYSDSDELKHWSFDKYSNAVALDRYDFYPATKEQRDILFQKMKEAGYEWDSVKKEVIRIN